MGDQSVAKTKPNSNSASSAHSKDQAYLQTVIPKRQLLFESIKSQQRIQRLSLYPDPIQIVLPDGKVKEGKKWNTTPFDLAKEISKSLSSNPLIAKVDGLLWDMHRPLEGDCKLALFTFDSDEGHDTFWHSHSWPDCVLGRALQEESLNGKVRKEIVGKPEEVVFSVFGNKVKRVESKNKRHQVRPEKYLGDLETLKKAEAPLAKALDEFGKPWEINEGDGAFYGPKIDISVSDAMRRKFQCATLQLDSYSAEDESKMEWPLMIHRAILGSVERMFAIILEHYKGKWPFWLSPARQLFALFLTSLSHMHWRRVRNRIHDAGFYVDVDTSDRTIQKKVREAQLAQYNYILVVGEEEANNGQVSVRMRDKAYHVVKISLHCN